MYWIEVENTPVKSYRVTLDPVPAPSDSGAFRWDEHSAQSQTSLTSGLQDAGQFGVATNVFGGTRISRSPRTPCF